MRGAGNRRAMKWVAGLSGVMLALSGLFAAVVWSDFANRGCHEIARADWAYTANCVDAYNVGLFASILAFISLIGLVWPMWRLLHV